MVLVEFEGENGERAYFMDFAGSGELYGDDEGEDGEEDGEEGDTAQL